MAKYNVITVAATANTAAITNPNKNQSEDRPKNYLIKSEKFCSKKRLDITKLSIFGTNTICKSIITA